MPTYNPPSKAKKVESPLLLTTSSEKPKANYSSRDKVYTTPIDTQTIPNKSSNDQMQKNFGRLQARLNLVTIMVILSFFFNFAVLFVQMQRDQDAQINSSTSQAVNNNPVQPKIQITNEQNNGNLIINSFQNNPAFFDYGFKVNVEPGSISSLDDSNCKTPTVPPTVNGCGFGLNFTKLGLPAGLIAYKSLSVEAEFSSPEDKIQLDIKDYQKGSIDQNITIITSDQNSKNLTIPASIPSSSGLYFRFWSASGVIKINQIILNYYSSNDLSGLKLNLDFSKLTKSFASASIYRDVNEDSRLDLEVDKKWECTSGFPGIDQIKLESKEGRNIDRSVQLLRDESCVIGTKPSNWAGDNRMAAIPSGKWLLVLDKDNYSPFQTDSNSKVTEINLSI